MKKRLLLVHDDVKGSWPTLVKEALAEIASIDIISQQDALEWLNSRTYDLIILDAASLGDAANLIRGIRLADQQSAKVLVATTSPNWMRARELFRAGANDSIYRFSNKEDILATVAAALD